MNNPREYEFQRKDMYMGNKAWNRFSKTVISIIVISFLMFSVGCSGSSTSGDPKIVIILKGLTTSYWYSVKKGAEDASKDLGIDVDILAPIQADNNEQQIQLLEEAVGKKYDVIAISPADSKGIIPGIELANEAGIPIVNYATSIIGDVEIASAMRIEDYDAQYKVTEFLADKIQEGEVIILEGIAGQQNALDKVEGAKAALANYPGITLVASQTANWVRNEAFTVTQNLLQAHPNLKGIIACNDDMAVGAAEAVDQAGKAGEIYISGMNSAVFALEALKEGRIYATIDIMAYELGYTAIETAFKIVNDEPYETNQTLETELVTQENVDQFLEKHRSIQE